MVVADDDGNISYTVRIDDYLLGVIGNTQYQGHLQRFRHISSTIQYHCFKEVKAFSISLVNHIDAKFSGLPRQSCGRFGRPATVEHFDLNRPLELWDYEGNLVRLNSSLDITPGSADNQHRYCNAT